MHTLTNLLNKFIVFGDIGVWYRWEAHHFYFLMIVLILNNVVVWLVTTVTHSLATYFNRNCKTHILYAKCERKHRITHKIIFHVNISKHLSGTSIKLVAMDTANDKY